MQPGIGLTNPFLTATASRPKNGSLAACKLVQASRPVSFFSSAKLTEKNNDKVMLRGALNQEKILSKENSTQKSLPRSVRPNTVALETSATPAVMSKNFIDSCWNQLQSLWVEKSSEVSEASEAKLAINYFRLKHDDVSIGLPNEMLFSILDYLSFRDLAALSMVDKNCNDMVKNFLGFELVLAKIPDYKDEIITFFKRLPVTRILNGDPCQAIILLRSYMLDCRRQFFNTSYLEIDYVKPIWASNKTLNLLPISVCEIYFPYTIRSMKITNLIKFTLWLQKNINSSIALKEEVINLGKNIELLENFLKEKTPKVRIELDGLQIFGPLHMIHARLNYELDPYNRKLLH
ncbi:MAG: F-box protein, partial [Burkholderiales bacterium]